MVENREEITHHVDKQNLQQSAVPGREGQAKVTGNRPPTLQAQDLDLGEIVGAHFDSMFFGCTQPIRPEDFVPVTSHPDGAPVRVTLDVPEVLLMGPGRWETEVTLTAREDLQQRDKVVSPPLPTLAASQTVKVMARVVYGNRMGRPIATDTLFDPPFDSAVPVQLPRANLRLTFRLYDCLGHEVKSEFGAGPPYVTGVSDLGPVIGSQPAKAVDFDGSSPEFWYCKDPHGVGRWTYELSTNDPGYIAGSTYELEILLNDGTYHRCRFIVTQ